MIVELGFVGLATLVERVTGDHGDESRESDGVSRRKVN
jgi:hypothetical protein